MKVAIIGAGPAGLYLALLLKKWGVSQDISIFEQNPRHATYGFGVGLTEGAMSRLAAADKTSHDALVQALLLVQGQVIEVPDGTVELNAPFGVGTITRLDLLQILQAHCASVGIEAHYEQRLADLSRCDGYDLIVGADGANSLVRRLNAGAFDVQTHKLGNRFAWYGVNKKLEAALRFRREGAGVFMAHYYPYTESMSTFLVEVDERTWEDGFGALSDDERKAISERVFADILDGQPLIENRSIWSQFEAIKVSKWAAGNMTLVGDALYRAHFSIGSGTRLAMEDSIALATALKEHPGDVPAALEAYQAVRLPQKQKLMSAAEKSYSWYDDIRAVIDLPVLEFAHAFLMRTGRMPEERLRMGLPDFMAKYDAYRAAVSA